MNILKNPKLYLINLFDKSQGHPNLSANILKNPELYLINLFDKLQLRGETD